MANPVQDLINVVDATFSKEDVHTVSRKVLEELVIRLYDGLNQINGTYPDWWDRVD